LSPAVDAEVVGARVVDDSSSSVQGMWPSSSSNADSGDLYSGTIIDGVWGIEEGTTSSPPPLRLFLLICLAELLPKVVQAQRKEQNSHSPTICIAVW